LAGESPSIERNSRRIAPMETRKKGEGTGIPFRAGGGTRVTAKLIKLDALASWPVHAMRQ